VFPATPAAKANVRSYASSERAGHWPGFRQIKKSSLIGYTPLHLPHASAVRANSCCPALPPASVQGSVQGAGIRAGKCAPAGAVRRVQYAAGEHSGRAVAESVLGKRNPGNATKPRIRQAGVKLRVGHGCVGHSCASDMKPDPGLAPDVASRARPDLQGSSVPQLKWEPIRSLWPTPPECEGGSVPV
jgi:hypothetical protein